MSIKATAWAKRQQTGSATMKAVLVAVADYADEDGFAWPSQQRLAKDTELADRSIRRALTDLEERGFIRRQKRPPKSNGMRQTDVIRLVFSPEDSVSRGGEATGHTGQVHRTDSPKPQDRVSDKPSENHHYEPSCFIPVTGEGLGSLYSEEEASQ